MKLQQLLRIQVPVECKILWKKTNSGFCTDISRLITENTRLSLVREDEPHEDAHAGRLPRSIGAQKGTNLAAGYLKGNTSKCGGLGAPLIDLSDAGELFGKCPHPPLLHPLPLPGARPNSAL